MDDIYKQVSEEPPLFDPEGEEPEKDMQPLSYTTIGLTILVLIAIICFLTSLFL